MSWLPERLPEKANFVWRRDLPSQGLGGISADHSRVIVGCRDSLDRSDNFMAFDAASGATLWEHVYEAPGKLDYGNSPRATPLILDDCIITLGAFGDLHCLDLETGAVLWQRNLQREFGGKLPTWGFCGTPLVVEQKVIVQVGAADAALVALDLDSGEVVWKSAGREVSYSSLVLASPSGHPQIVGFDQTSLGGWSLADGCRFWEVIADLPNEFNVPTPLVDDAGIFVATENNGSRRYEFGSDGVAKPTPAATFESFAPDMHTGVQVGSRIFGIHGDLFCLDAKTLQPIWTGSDDAFGKYASLIASPDSLLALTIDGELLLIDTRRDQFSITSRLSLAEDVDIFSHPAFVAKRMYVRLGTIIACIDLSR